MPFHIRTASDLRSLSRRKVLSPKHDRLVLAISDLDGMETKAWEGKLSRHYLSCGCELGSVFVLVAVAADAVVIALAPGGFAAAGGKDLAIGAGVALAAAAVGKAVGLIYARVRLRATITALTQRLALTEATADR